MSCQCARPGHQAPTYCKSCPFGTRSTLHGADWHHPEDTWAVNYNNGFYQYVKGDYLLQWDGQQTKDLKFENGAVYNLAGKTNESVSTAINQVGSKKATAKLKIYSINGQKVAEVGSMADAEYILAPGVYVCGGKKYVIK